MIIYIFEASPQPPSFHPQLCTLFMVCVICEQVNILEPPLSQKHPEKTENSDTIKLTKDNHVEWQITVKETDKKEITLKYTIEYPAGEAIDITTVWTPMCWKET